MITFYINVFLKSTQQMTDVLQILNQHQHSVFLRTIYSIPKRATSHIYIYIYRMEWFSLPGAPNGMGHIWPPVQKSTKKCEKLERKYCTKNLCIIDVVEICNSSIHHFKYFLGNWSRNFGMRVWKKAWFNTPT